jgi:hypothetical protein
MERSTMLLMGKSTISMAIFNSYFDITRGFPAKMDGQLPPKDEMLVSGSMDAHGRLIVGGMAQQKNSPYINHYQPLLTVY